MGPAGASALRVLPGEDSGARFTYPALTDPAQDVCLRSGGSSLRTLGVTGSDSLIRRARLASIT